MNNKVKTLQQTPHILLFLAIIFTMIILISFSLLISNEPSATLHLVKTENGKVISVEETNSNNIK